MPPSDTPLLTFIVPAHNEEALIERSLRSIHESVRALGVSGGAPAYELIVVDDDSSDRTGEIALRLGARVERVALRRISRVRNAGARVARGRFLFFIDADTRATPEVLAAALKALDSCAVGGGACVRFDGRIPLWARLMFPSIMFLYRSMRYAAGCFVFCTREAFEAVGGFDESVLAGEEVLLSRALKSRGRFVVVLESVITSGRKLRTHSFFELWGAVVRLGLGGERALRDARRRDFAIWYGPRREDHPS